VHEILRVGIFGIQRLRRIEVVALGAELSWRQGSLQIVDVLGDLLTARSLGFGASLPIRLFAQLRLLAVLQERARLGVIGIDVEDLVQRSDRRLVRSRASGPLDPLVDFGFLSGEPLLSLASLGRNADGIVNLLAKGQCGGVARVER
jgi:hypothetical protein